MSIFYIHKQFALHAVVSDSSSTPTTASPALSSTRPFDDATSASTTSTNFVFLLGFWLGCIIYQQGIGREGFGQYEVANIVAPDREGVKSIPVACRHLDFLRCVFICISTPAGAVSALCAGKMEKARIPVIVPCTTEPFLSSIVPVQFHQKSVVKNVSNVVNVQHNVSFASKLCLSPANDWNQLEHT